MAVTHDVLRRASDALRKHPHLRSIRVTLRPDSDRLILEGSVESFFIKQMAQEAIREVEQDVRVDNRLSVCRPVAPNAAAVSGSAGMAIPSMVPSAPRPYGLLGTPPHSVSPAHPGASAPY